MVGTEKFETTSTGVGVTGDITLSGTVDGRDIAADGQDLDDLVTLSGVSANSTNLGTFTGSTIADNETIKGALQDLEDGVEAKLPLSGGTLTGNVSNTSTGHLQVSVGTTAQRTGTPSSGMFRFNSETASFEGYNGTDWGSIGGGGAGGATVSSRCSPSSPSEGDLWFDTDSANMYIYFNDGDSSQWVVTGNGATIAVDTLPELP